MRPTPKLWTLILSTWHILKHSRACAPRGHHLLPEWVPPPSTTDDQPRSTTIGLPLRLSLPAIIARGDSSSTWWESIRFDSIQFTGWPYITFLSISPTSFLPSVPERWYLDPTQEFGYRLDCCLLQRSFTKPGLEPPEPRFISTLLNEDHDDI